MKDSRISKIAFFKNEKKFDEGYGNMCECLAEAMLYPDFMLDEEIIKQFDKDYQEQVEIWKIRVTYETI